MKKNLKKHSITIAGHATSITLEDAFWDELNRIAHVKGTSLNALVTVIDKEKAPDTNLSSALRVFVLNFLKAQ